MGNCPLSEYKDDGEFKYINKEYPGLIAVHKDPWIFVVPQFLNKEECNSLIQYSSPHLNTSVSFVDNKICKNNDRKSPYQIISHFFFFPLSFSKLLFHIFLYIKGSAV